MPVSSNFRAISTLILIGALGACKPAATSSESQKVSYDAVSYTHLTLPTIYSV